MMSKDSIFLCRYAPNRIALYSTPKAFCAYGSGFGAWAASPLTFLLDRSNLKRSAGIRDCCRNPDPEREGKEVLLNKFFCAASMSWRDPWHDLNMKTNAVRLLETLGIKYALREYKVDPDDLAAETVAAKIGMAPEQVFKTLLARGDRHGLCFAVIPANTELDLKALAAAIGDRKMELVPVKELLGLTGYIRGGVTVLGAKKAFPVFADETIQLWDSISVSAGVRGTQIILRPEDYLRVTEAVMADIARGK
jgi:Cys-tRNA(Pro)/Cys-tRNA(Cys) deacylase